MASHLDPVFRGVIRQAEKIDTRMGIRREEPQDEHKRKKRDEEGMAEEDGWTDSAIVSVRALRAFLAGLLGPEEGAAETRPAAPAGPAPATRPAASPETARAIGAYRNAPRGTLTDRTDSPPVPAPPAAPSSSPAPNLSPQDREEIRALLRACDRLATHQIDELRIEKSDSFLHSLAEAARRKLAEIEG